MKNFLFLLFFAAFGLFAEKTICLNMIVKDEESVIERCLASVKPFIDRWVIVDTGSSDQTKEKIKKTLKGIPGELYERPWVNFGHNRNEALQLAKGKGDYALFIDADEVLEGSFQKKDLNAECYLIAVRTRKDPLMTFQRGFLVNQHLNWSWQGVIHEKLMCDKIATITPALLDHVCIAADTEDGHRAQDPDKYLKDAKVLEKALEETPNNEEYVYYLAQSYHNAKKYDLALKNYEKRAAMAGWDQHTFWSKYMAASIQELLQMKPEIFIQSYCDAFAFRPTRAEPIFRLAQHYFNEKKYLIAHALASFGKTLEIPDDLVYVEPWMYDWGFDAVLANSALEMKWYTQAASAYEVIAGNGSIPENIRKQANETIRWIQTLSQYSRLNRL